MEALEKMAGTDSLVLLWKCKIYFPARSGVGALALALGRGF
jgi:hypothetical protein